MPRTKLRQGQTQTSKEEGSSTARTTAQIEKYYSGGKREFTYKKNDRGKVIKIELKGGGMSSGQAKIAAKAPPPNKIDAKDFAVLRQEKAKGRGMGLQDESIKPGKVMKAALGIMAMKKAKDKGAKGAEFLSPIMLAKRMFNKKAGGVMKYKRGSGLDLPVISSVKPTVNKSKRAQNLSEMKIQFNKQKSRMGKNPNTKKFSSMAEMRAAKGFKPGESASEFNKRRMALNVAKKAASATTVGKIALGVGAAGIGAAQYLKSKMNDKNNKTLRDAREQKKPGIPSETTQKINKALSNIKTVTLKKDKKMGGGMMQRPMGYKGGGMDTGRVGEMKSRIAVAVDRIKKAKKSMGIGSGPIGGGRLTDSDKEKIKNLIGKNKAARPIKRNMGGMMMQKPMGYKHGTSVTAKCKLGRNKPTKIT